jgi:predicted mannosyl-3-phosphoglycerate phosphatase (HAD superfamily)
MSKKPCEICKDRIKKPALKAYRKEQNIRKELARLRAEVRRLRNKMKNWIYRCSCSKEFKTITGLRNHQRNCDGVLRNEL